MEGEVSNAPDFIVHNEGDTVVKYDHDIGRAIAEIPVGAYVHAHNIKTKRW